MYTLSNFNDRLCILEKVCFDPHLNGCTYSTRLHSCHSTPCCKLLEALLQFQVTNDNNNKILTS